MSDPASYGGDFPDVSAAARYGGNYSDFSGVGVVLVAAGRGERLGGGEPKALQLIGGEPMVVHAVRAFAGLVEALCVVVPAGTEEQVRALLADEPLDRRPSVVAGAATRQGSVAAGLRGLPDDIGVVLVHDAARPFVPATVVRTVIDSVRSGAAAVVPVLPVTDTIKQVDVDGDVVVTLDRAGLRAVQTPQGFERAALLAAHRCPTSEVAMAGEANGDAIDDAVSAAVTDDAALIERVGGRVATVPGSPESFKITTPADLEQAERLLAGRNSRRTP